MIGTVANVAIWLNVSQILIRVFYSILHTILRNKVNKVCKEIFL